MKVSLRRSAAVVRLQITLKARPLRENLAASSPNFGPKHATNIGPGAGK